MTDVDHLTLDSRDIPIKIFKVFYIEKKKSYFPANFRKKYFANFVTLHKVAQNNLIYKYIYDTMLDFIKQVNGFTIK